MINYKLIYKITQELKKGEIDWEFFKPYSKIKLNKKRNFKKFKKDFKKYLTKNVLHTYFGCVMVKPLTRSIFHDLPNVQSISKLDIKPYYIDVKN